MKTRDSNHLTFLDGRSILGYTSTMKVTLPITEKFLWGLYSVIESVTKANEVFGRRSFQEAFCPELRRIRYDMRRKYGAERTRQLIYRLKKSGLIKAPDWEVKDGIVVTSKGMEKIFYIRAKMGLKRRQDKKWEMVVFDIPERKRKLRNGFRERLKLLGYQKLQQSIWISPFDVLDETQHVISAYDLEDSVRIFVVEKP